ncbi:DUF4429 domain-containing protein [Streptomyces sp. Je 1-79]|uniref:DUF4429 domain-containing protein n=1 Tax=Streptomyces sp. Je 1-79 TaxID=2943847 RepID=UPI0021A88528|nr:DUF4429 domain-containing protein [Streptomyces sp. Je 1-79]MCT4352871.1 DUF4429 domain-containing protein [Streptomyces sp. Je 1-79]
MGDVLAGIHATWEFESDAVVIRFERGIRTPKLFQALGERRIPHEALASVTLAPGKRGTVVLQAVPRRGADPLMEAAAGQLKPGYDPYRLVLPAERETLAEYYRDELRDRLAPGDEPSDGFLVTAPRGPQSFKAYDGKATFDGSSEVAFRWFWTGASSEKWKAGDQTFPVRELGGVEWRSPDVFDGYLRLLPRSGQPRSAQADRDPAAVVFGLGYGPVHESLPFAAAVLEAVRGAGRVAATPVDALPEARDPAGVAERIRHLGELHRAGLVTDEEFTAKKSELLSEL